VIDAMHSLLLGSGKHLLATMTKYGIFAGLDFELMQQYMDTVACPREVGAVPRRIASKMAFLKADQVTKCVLKLICNKHHAITLFM
jgi:hypothetical protein